MSLRGRNGMSLRGRDEVPTEAVLTPSPTEAVPSGARLQRVPNSHPAEAGIHRLFTFAYCPIPVFFLMRHENCDLCGMRRILFYFLSFVLVGCLSFSLLRSSMTTE